jgi:hypothetical protein
VVGTLRRVVEFLSDAWIAALDRAARASSALAAIGARTPIVVEQRVRGGGGECAYALSLNAAGARVDPGPAAAPDLVLSTDPDTARALQDGALTMWDAVLAGRVKVRGRAEQLRAAGEALRAVGDVFRDVRRVTTDRISVDEDRR